MTDETAAAVEYLEQQFARRRHPSGGMIISLIDDHAGWCQCDRGRDFRGSKSTTCMGSADETDRRWLSSYYGVSDIEFDNPPRWIA